MNSEFDENWKIGKIEKQKMILQFWIKHLGNYIMKWIEMYYSINDRFWQYLCILSRFLVNFQIYNYISIKWSEYLINFMMQVLIACRNIVLIINLVHVKLNFINQLNCWFKYVYIFRIFEYFCFDILIKSCYISYLH